MSADFSSDENAMLMLICLVGEAVAQRVVIERMSRALLDLRDEVGQGEAAQLVASDLHQDLRTLSELALQGGEEATTVIRAYAATALHQIHRATLPIGALN